MGTLKSSIRKVTIRAMIFLIYLFLGAGIFFGLESSASEQRFNEEKNKFTIKKEEYMRSYNINHTDWENIERFMYSAWRNGINRSSYEDRWTFGSSFFFCGNVITTIGYGTVVPKTDFGKLVMMIYALFGIPLTGFFLRTVGNELTNLIAFLIKLYERRWFNREADRLEVKCAFVASVLALFMLSFGAVLFQITEHNAWGFLNGFYFSFVTLTTIGFGDLVPVQNKSLSDGSRLGIEMALLVYYVLGLSIMSGVIVSISGVIEEKTKKLDITDPMEAIRNLRLENLNSKAMKKLGYKVDEGPNLHGNLPHQYLKEDIANRRGTIVPEDDAKKKNSRVHLEQPRTAEKITKILKDKLDGKDSKHGGNQSLEFLSRQLEINTDFTSASSPKTSLTTVNKEYKGNGISTNINSKQIRDDLNENIGYDYIKIKQQTINSNIADFPNGDNVISLNNNHNNIIRAENNVSLDVTKTSLNPIEIVETILSPSSANHDSVIKQNENKVCSKVDICIVSVSECGETQNVELNHTEHSEETFKTESDAINSTNVEKSFLYVNNFEDYENEYCYINNERVHATTKIKERKKQKNSKTHSDTSLNRLKSIKKQNKRIGGLPAELFANRVSVTLEKTHRQNVNLPQRKNEKISRDNSFYRIPIISDDASEIGYSNSSFENEEKSCFALSPSRENKTSGRYQEKRRSRSTGTNDITSC